MIILNALVAESIIVVTDLRYIESNPFIQSFFRQFQPQYGLGQIKFTKDSVTANATVINRPATGQQLILFPCDILMCPFAFILACVMFMCYLNVLASRIPKQSYIS